MGILSVIVGRINKWRVPTEMNQCIGKAHIHKFAPHKYKVWLKFQKNVSPGSDNHMNWLRIFWIFLIANLETHTNILVLWTLIKLIRLNKFFILLHNFQIQNSDKVAKVVHKIIYSFRTKFCVPHFCNRDRRSSDWDLKTCQAWTWTSWVSWVFLFRLQEGPQLTQRENQRCQRQKTKN